MYCPYCQHSKLGQFNNNHPVGDFYCPCCNSEFELKSKNGKLGQSIPDGAYSTMIQRITSNSNPDLFLMSYSAKDNMVNDFVFVPKHFFVTDIIDKRNPLSSTARRAGWVGCNIAISKIPNQGKIYVVNNGTIIQQSHVIQQSKKSALLETTELISRGWLLDILNCVNTIRSDTFTLSQIYDFELLLSLKYPQNKNVKAKIRQQLQILRDKEYIEFLGKGYYKKIH